MNVNSWLKEAKKRIDSLDADLILMDVLGKSDRAELISGSNLELSEESLAVLEKLVQAREMRVPLAYIISHKEFYGRDFYVEKSVLIPRVETETMIDLLKELIETSEDEFSGLVRILDVGTGSGCIAVTTALEIPNAEVVGIDNSSEALIVAAKNASRLGAVVKFLESDLLENVRSEKYDVMMANLPYVDRDWDFLSPELKWEPKNALYADDEGMAVIYRFLNQVAKYKNARYLIIECDESQQEKLKNYLSKLKMEIVKTREYQTVIKTSF